MWRFKPPSVTLRIKYPAGNVPLVGSAVTVAGVICRQVPAVPAATQKNSARFWSRQKSPTFHAPEVGGPISVFGPPFC